MCGSVEELAVGVGARGKELDRRGAEDAYLWCSHGALLYAGWRPSSTFTEGRAATHRRPAPLPFVSATTSPTVLHCPVSMHHAVLSPYVARDSRTCTPTKQASRPGEGAVSGDSLAELRCRWTCLASKQMYARCSPPSARRRLVLREQRLVGQH